MNLETRLPFALGDDDRDAERSAMRLEHEAYRKIEEAQRILKDAAILSELKRKELLDYASALTMSFTTMDCLAKIGARRSARGACDENAR